MWRNPSAAQQAGARSPQPLSLSHTQRQPASAPNAAATVHCVQVRGWATDINDPRLTEARRSVEREMVRWGSHVPCRCDAAVVQGMG